MWQTGFILIVTYCYMTNAVTVIGKGYTDLVVTLSPELSQEQGNDYITELKILLQSASEKLFAATRRGVYFHEVKVILPPSWNGKAFGIEEVETVTNELFERATIHLTSNLSRLGELRTQQSGECGQEGDYIEISAGFLNNLKHIDENAKESASRLFVRNWAKYRYGVFDEIPTFKSKYFVDDRECRITGCYDTHNLQFHNLTTEDKGVLKCEGQQNIDSILSQHKPTASLMFMHELDTVRLFCDSLHIPEAPTIHNRFCKEQSVWDVIKQSSDFKAMQRNLPVPTTIPRFKYFQEKPRRYVFAVQEIFSKKVNTKMIAEVLEKAIQMIVERVFAEDTEIGVVMLRQNGSKVMVPLTKLSHNQDERWQLVKDFFVQRDPTNSTTHICAMCGIEKASKMLSSSQRSDTVIIVAENSVFHYLPWSVVKTKLPRARLGAIAIVSDPEEIREFPSDDNVILAPIQSAQNSVSTWWNFMMAILSILHSPEEYINKISMVHQNIFTRTRVNGTFSTKVQEPQVHKNLSILACIDTPDINWRFVLNQQEIKERFHSYPCIIYNEPVVDENVHEWSYKAMTKGDLKIEKFAIIALVLHELEKETIHSWMRKVDSKAPAIFCECKQKQAKITATVYDSNGEAKAKTQLYDSGYGDPDKFKGDDVFSRYLFANMLPSGFYSIYVMAEIPIEETMKPLTLIVHSGYLTLSEETMGIVPSRITDLRVETIDHDNRRFTLAFTAPTGNLDNGRAERYEVKYSMDRNSFFVNPDLPQSECSDLKNIPKSEGTPEIVSVQLPSSAALTKSLIYATIQAAINDTTGELSNIVQIHLRGDSEVPSDQWTTHVPVSYTIDKTTLKTTNFGINSTEGSVKPNAGSLDGLSNKQLIIIASTSLGVFVFLVLIVNTAVCFYCYKRNIKKRYAKQPLQLEKSWRNSNRGVSNIDMIMQSSGDINDPDNYSGSMVECYNRNFPHHLANQNAEKQPSTQAANEHCSSECLIHGSNSRNTTGQNRLNHSIYNVDENVDSPRSNGQMDSNKGTSRKMLSDVSGGTSEVIYAQSTKRQNIPSRNSVAQDLGVV